MCEQVSGGRAIEMACEEISLFFFAVGILYLLLVFFAIQVRNLNRWWSIYVKHRLLRPRDVRSCSTVERLKAKAPSTPNPRLLLSRPVHSAFSAPLSRQRCTALERY